MGKAFHSALPLSGEGELLTANDAPSQVWTPGRRTQGHLCFLGV